MLWFIAVSYFPFIKDNEHCLHTSERKEWKYPFRAYLEAEYTAWPGEGTFPAALLIWW